MPSTIHGTLEPGFEALGDAFARAQRQDEGFAQLAVYQEGRLVADLWTGRDAIGDRPVGPDSIGVLMSVTKGVVATCAHHLAEHGRLDLDSPVASYWPEFAAHGKGGTTVADLLTHRAGLSGFEPEAGISAALLPDWDRCVAALAGMRPLWEPGTACSYHPLTFGYLVGEVIRRATGAGVGRLLAEEIAAPLGLDLWIGLPEGAQSRFLPQFTRAAHPTREQATAYLAGHGIDAADRLMRNTLDAIDDTRDTIDLFNRPEGQAAEIPAANGIGTARSLARLYASTIGPVDGTRLLSAETVRRATAPQTDHVPPPPPLHRLPQAHRSRFGLGYELPQTGVPMLGPGSFGHAGAGGRLAFAQPRTGTAVAYLCTNMAWDPPTGPDPRWLPWTAALRGIVEAPAHDAGDPSGIATR